MVDWKNAIYVRIKIKNQNQKLRNDEESEQ